MSRPVTLLVDNGSAEPAAVLRLRELAQQLAGIIGGPVSPVSLQHSDGVPAELLGGVPAETLRPALERRMALGQREFMLLPLFFGPSRALTEYLPRLVQPLQEQHPDLRLRLAPEIHAPGDPRLAQIIADHVRQTRPGALPYRVALVDHGSPVRAVTAVRESLAGQLQELLGPEVPVAACSMERRPGPAYAFNEPLLEGLLGRPEWTGEVVVALQFLLPGRHAGPDGDVAQICHRVVAARPALHPHLTPLVGSHPALAGILADRWREPGRLL